LYRIGFASQDYVHKVLDEEDFELEQFSSKAEANSFCQLISSGGGVAPKIETETIPKGHDDVEMMTEVMLKNILVNTSSTEYMLHISGPSNYRIGLATIQEYKGNRDRSTRPLHYQYIKDYLIDKHPHIISDNCEADDTCSISLWDEFKKARKSKRKSSCEAILCSIDKDLLGTPGYHYNISSKEIIWQTPSMANLHFAKQILTGDRVDNIPGLSVLSGNKLKVGPVKSTKILEDCTDLKSYYEAICGVYEEWVGENWHDKLQEVGSLLYMQREPEQVFNIKEWSKGLYDEE
jgi:hypothetical protein